MRWAGRLIEIEKLILILQEHLQRYSSFLNLGNGWKLALMVELRYYILLYLKEECIKYREMKDNGKMLSLIEIEMIQQEIQKHHKNTFPNVDYLVMESVLFDIS